MSWSRRRFVCVAVVALATTGCGFRPLYQPSSGAAGPLDSFAQVSVAPIPDRIGHQLRNKLLDLLTPQGAPTHPTFELRVTLNETLTELAVEETALATRGNLRLAATMQLVDATSGSIVFASGTSTVSSYDILTSDFATLSAENDARSRAAGVLAEDIRLRLGAFFTERRRSAR